MDITGKIIFASTPREGISKASGNKWKSQDFVIETQDTYPRKCVFTVFGEDRLRQFNLQVGGSYTVSFDIDAHEYNGRWFNDIRAWRVGPAQAPAAAPYQGGAPYAAATPAAPAASAAAPAPSAPAAPAANASADPLAGDSMGNDDLPF